MCLEVGSWALLTDHDCWKVSAELAEAPAVYGSASGTCLAVANLQTQCHSGPSGDAAKIPLTRDLQWDVSIHSMRPPTKTQRTYTHGVPPRPSRRYW